MGAFSHCEQLVRAADKDRFLAALFAPAEQRGALLALYAFDGEISGVRERAREPMPGEIRLQWWREVLRGERANEAAANPVASALLNTIARFALPVEPLQELIDAHSFDLYGDPMPTLAALEGYGRKTEAAIFTLASGILADCDDRGTVAEHAGLARAITGVLRGLARHASRGQVYLPIDLLDRHGARVEDIFAGRATPALHDALAELRAEARRHVAAFEESLTQLPPAAVPAFLSVSLVPGSLAAMERPGYDPFRTAIEIPQWRRQWTLWRASRRYAGLARG